MSGGVIRQTGKPKRPVGQIECLGLVVEHHNAMGLEGPSDARAVVPPVVIAQDREGAIARLERRKAAGRRVGFDETAEGNTMDHVVAQQHHKVRPPGIHPRHHLIELGQVDVRRADMQIAQNCNPERRFTGRPAFCRDANLAKLD